MGKYHEFPGNKGTFGDWRESYERVVPERFEGDTGDTFTKKMIKEYAIENDVKFIKNIHKFKVLKSTKLLIKFKSLLIRPLWF